MSTIQECLSFEVNGWTVEILELFIISRVSVVERRLLSVCVCVCVCVCMFVFVARERGGFHCISKNCQYRGKGGREELVSYKLQI